MRILTLLVLLTVASLPLEGLYELPVAGSVSRLAGTLAAVAWAVLVLQTGRFRRPHVLHGAMLLFVLWNAASVSWTLDGPATQERVLTYAQLLAFSVVVWETLRTAEALRGMLVAYLAGCCTAALSLVALYVLRPEAVDWHGRATIGDFNPNDAALILALGVPVALHLVSSADAVRLQRPVMIAAAGYVPLGTFAVLMTGSRAALAALGPAAVYAGWLLWRRRPAHAVGAGVGLAGMLTAAVPLLPERALARFAGTGAELMRGNLNERQDVWGEAVRLIGEHPVLGVGSGAFRTAAVGVGKVGHNLVLTLLAELGVAGLALFVAMVVVACGAIRTAPGPLRALWCTLLTSWLFAAMLHNWEYRKVTWLLLTLVVASASLRAEHPDVTDSAIRRTPPAPDAGGGPAPRQVDWIMSTRPVRPRAVLGALLASVALVLLAAGPGHADLPDTPYPQVQRDQVLRTSPFPGTAVSMEDNEGSTYVARDRSLWLADDDGRRVYEIDPFTGALKRTIDETALMATPPLGGGTPAGTFRVRDLEALAYDASDDVLYLFSGNCCKKEVLPTVFRLTRDAAGVFQLDAYRPLPTGSDFTAAAWNPAEDRLYVGGQSYLRSYDFASNTVGTAFQVPHLSRITGLDFSADGQDLFAAHAITKVSRVKWSTRTMVGGWSFDLSSAGILDARAVALFADRLWVSDGYDFRAGDDPLAHAVVSFAVTTPPPGFNIVGNPGFEQGLTGWNYGGNVAAALDRVGSPRSGSWAARLTNISSTFTTLTLNDSPNWVGQTVPGTYTVRAWVRSTNSTAPVILRIREYDEAGVHLRTLSDTVPLSPTWQQLTLTVTPPPGGNTDLDLNVYAYKVPAGTTVDVDDVEISFN